MFMQAHRGVDCLFAVIRGALLSLIEGRQLLQREMYALLLGRYREGKDLLHLLILSCLQLSIILAPKWPIRGDTLGSPSPSRSWEERGRCRCWSRSQAEVPDATTTSPILWHRPWTLHSSAGALFCPRGTSSSPPSSSSSCLTRSRGEPLIASILLPLASREQQSWEEHPPMRQQVMVGSASCT